MPPVHRGSLGVVMPFILQLLSSDLNPTIASETQHKVRRQDDNIHGPITDIVSQ